MSKAQSCANVMRRYGLNHPPDSIARGCYDSTCMELERLNFVAEGQALLIAELEKQLEAVRNDAARLEYAIRSRRP